MAFGKLCEVITVDPEAVEMVITAHDTAAQTLLVDLTTVEYEDLAEMIYTIANVIDDGRIAGTVLEDYGAISATAVSVCTAIMEGKIVSAYMTPPYTTYGG